MSERVTVYIDKSKMDVRASAEIEIGMYLGTQGITDVLLVEPPTQAWLGLSLSKDDAFTVIMRFPIVPDSDVQRFVNAKRSLGQIKRNHHTAEELAAQVDRVFQMSAAFRRTHAAELAELRAKLDRLDAENRE